MILELGYRIKNWWIIPLAIMFQMLIFILMNSCYTGKRVRPRMDMIQFVVFRKGRFGFE